jgi:WD40 repeat protein
MSNPPSASGAAVAPKRTGAVSRPRQPNVWAPLFGYDIFLSYARKDAAGYAAALAVRLRDLDYSVFLDQDDAPASLELTPTLEKALARSRTLVVVVSQEAPASQWVQLEVERFTSTHPGRAVAAIDIGSTFANLSTAGTSLAALRARNPIWISERPGATETSEPAPATIDAISGLQLHLRSNQKRRWTVRGVIAALAVFGAIAIWQARTANSNAREAGLQRDAAILAQRQAQLESVRAETARRGEAAQRLLAEDRQREAERRRLLLAIRSMALETPRQLSATHDTDERAGLLAVAAHRLNRNLDGDGAGLVDSAMRAVIDSESIADVLPEGAGECFGADSFVVWDPNGTLSVQKLDGSPAKKYNLNRESVDIAPDCRTWVIDPLKPAGLDLGRLGVSGALRLDDRKVSHKYSEDGRWLAAWADDGRIRVWSLAIYPPGPAREMQLPGRPPFQIAIDNQGLHVAVIDAEGAFNVCEASSVCASQGRFPRATYDDGTLQPARIAWSRNGRLLAIAVAGRLTVYDSRSVIFTASDAYYNDVRFDPAGNRVYWSLSASDPIFKRADLSTGETRTFTSLGDLAGHLAFDLAGRRLFVSDVSYPRMWRIDPEPTVRVLNAPLRKTPEYSVPALALNRNGKELWYNAGERVFTAGLNGPGKPASTDPEQKLPNLILLCGGNLVAKGAGEESSWRTEHWPAPARARFDTAACTPDGDTLVAAEFGVEIWRRNGKEGPVKLTDPTARRPSHVRSVAVDSSGNRVFAGYDDGSVYSWTPATLTTSPVRVSNHPFGEGGSAIVAISNDDRWLATAGGDSVIRLWKLGPRGADPKPVQEFRGHERFVESISFSADGSKLVSGGEDMTVRVWNLRKPDDPPIVLRGHGETVRHALFTPDGRRVVSQSNDFEVRVWRIAPEELADELCSLVMRNLTRPEWNQFVGSDISYERTCPQWPAARN